MTALRIIEAPPDFNWWAAEPGDMWPCQLTVSASHVVEGRAPCWMIRLPGAAWVWHTNGKSTDAGTYWTVTGEPPNITVSPSINIGPEIWHGFIRDGEMTPA